jgi:hypothetical protein
MWIFSECQSLSSVTFEPNSKLSSADQSALLKDAPGLSGS